MKNTIHGFNQAMLIELGLDNDDALILRWFVDFKDTGKMVSKIIDHEKYYWIKYEGVMKDLPILKVKTKDSLYRRLKKISATDVLKHTTVKEKGTYSFYTIGEKYISLIDDNYKKAPVGNKSDSNKEGTEINPIHGTEINPYQKINLLNKTNLLNTCSSCDELWKLYPRKHGKAIAYKKIPKLIEKYGYEQIERCVNRYVEEIKNMKIEKQYMKYGSTFFTSGYVDYLDENYITEENTDKANRPGRVIELNIG